MVKGTDLKSMIQWDTICHEKYFYKLYKMM